MITQIPLSFFAVIFSGLLLIIVNFTTAIIVGKRFDKLLKTKGVPLPLNYAVTIPDSWGRALNYCIFILVNGPRQSSGYGKLCRGFRFKKYAIKRDFYTAWVNVLVLIIFSITVLWACGLGPKILITFHT